MTSWSFQPLLPVQHIVGCALVVALAAGAACLRAWKRGVSPVRCGVLLGLRWMLIGGVATVLLRPVRMQGEPADRARPVFTVLVDVSESMNTRDVAGEARWSAVQAALEKGQRTWMRALAREHDLELVRFDQYAQRVRLGDLLARTQADGAQTDLALALSRGTPGNRPAAGVLLLSDGRENTGGDLAASARLLKASATPVWSVCVGSSADVNDIYVSGRLSQSFLFAGQPGALTAVLSQSGYDGLPVDVDLYREDVYLESRRVVLDQGVVQVSFPIREEQKGVYKYRLSVDPIASELETRNNARTVFVRVADDKLRILLVESRPHWDSKFLLRALQADPNLEVSSIFYVKPDKAYALREQSTVDGFDKETVRASLELPRTREALSRYDCLILGKEMDRLMGADELARLRDYLVEGGGSIVFYRGRSAGPNSALAAIEPVRWADDLVEDVQMELTPEGRVSPVFSFRSPQAPDLIVRSMPSLTSVTRIEEEKALSVVLAVAGGAAERMAVISTHRYGQGKVMSIAADGLWRWSFLPSAGDELASVYQELWSRIVRWAAMDSEFLPNQDIAFSTDGYTFQPGERMRLRVRTRHLEPDRFHPRIEVQPPDGEPVRLVPARVGDEPERRVAQYTPEVEGEYTARLISNIGQPREQEIRFTAYADRVETRLVAADAAALAMVSAITGGDTLTLDALDTLPERIRERAELARIGDRPEDIWDRWPIFLALVAALGLEWLLRRGWGLV